VRRGPRNHTSHTGPRPVRRPAGLGPEILGATPEQAKLLQPFMRDGRLVSMPARAAKRRVLLDLLAGLFEPGQRYPEIEVNRILGRFHDDYATLRRSLVDEGFLDRGEGVYWRAGGTFDVD
jgi:hypothetical protein